MGFLMNIVECMSGVLLGISVEASLQHMRNLYRGTQTGRLSPEGFLGLKPPSPSPLKWVQGFLGLGFRDWGLGFGV